MFELTPTWHNFDFGQLLLCIGTKNGIIWRPRGLKSDFEQCSTWPDFTFGQVLIWIGYNNDQICLPGCYICDFDLLSLLVNLWIWPNFILWSILCGQKANYKWRSYQADRPLVEITENDSYIGMLSNIELPICHVYRLYLSYTWS